MKRRAFLSSGAAVLGGSVIRPGASTSRELGAPRSGYGERSKFETSVRSFNPGATPATGAGRAPLQDLYGIITPSALHFERIHSGIPDIDPGKHELLIDGLVEKPLVFTMGDLKRLPSVSRIHFIECAGNSGREHKGRPGETVQISHGLLSCSEWTGVSLKVLLEQVGLRRSARWIVAEGADASQLNRSLPVPKALDDVIVAYAQNGEAVRPSQGYPVRLLVPGWEGNVNIKWLGHLQVTEEPYMTRDEAAFYTDLMANGTARRFTFVMEAKSVITRPSGGHHLDGPGLYEISGLAWSGRGKITRVEVSTDDGQSWTDAMLDEPVLSKAVTRFRLPWRWSGEEVSIQSRCTDDTGYMQPTREALVAARGMNGNDHYNGIKLWYVHKDGVVSHV